jgi:hypothetical protein
MESLVKEGSICSVLFKARIIIEEDIKAALEKQKILSIACNSWISTSWTF